MPTFMEKWGNAKAKTPARTTSRSLTVGFSRFKVSFIMQSTVMITTINESEELGRIDRNELEAARGCQDKALASRAPEPRKGEGKRST